LTCSSLEPSAIVFWEKLVKD